MHPSHQNPVLVIIDVQDGFDEPGWGNRNNPQAERNIARLLGAWRRAGLPLFHIQHLSGLSNSPLRAGSPGAGIKDIVRPLADEPVIQKRVNSAFIGTDLEARLRRGDFDTLVITGLTTNHCVETTTRMAGNLGFEAYLVSDATATFDRMGPDGRLHRAEDIHAMTLVNLHGEFATITDTEEVLAWLARGRRAVNA